VFSWLSLSIGGILPNVLAILFGTSNLNVDYNTSLAIPAIVAFLILIVSIRFHEKVEDHNNKLNKLNFNKRF
jgi:hypothetical protein